MGREWAVIILDWMVGGRALLPLELLFLAVAFYYAGVLYLVLVPHSTFFKDRYNSSTVLHFARGLILANKSIHIGFRFSEGCNTGAQSHHQNACACSRLLSIIPLVHGISSFFDMRTDTCTQHLFS